MVQPEQWQLTRSKPRFSKTNMSIRLHSHASVQRRNALKLNVYNMLLVL